jgi:unsaturated rhamnogalacturonyl hydrolase
MNAPRLPSFRWLRLILGPLGALLIGGVTAAAELPEPAAKDIVAALKKSADWQLANPSGTELRDWVIAPLYDGLVRTALTTNDPKYLAAVIRLGQQAGWMAFNRKYHADDYAVGHAWLDVYQLDPTRRERLEPMKRHLDYILAHPVTEALDFRNKPATQGVDKTDRWTWCDALYMAPPTLARMAAITGDARYLAFLDQEYRYTYDQLYDRKEKLFYRDTTFLEKKTPQGKKTFWSRGNGWVYGGFALLLEALPKDHPKRDFYVSLYREMTAAVVAAQQPDGLWRPSLLDPTQVPVGETSGSGFFVYGLAWGVNQGLLDRATYWPLVKKGWAGLLTRIGPEGYVGYVQKIGAAPDALDAKSRQDYGTGAFLLAGTEVLRGAGGATPPADRKAFLAQAEAQAEMVRPQAYARLVPERKDDLAWENDKAAFRIYGPALRDGPEDSGIDIWCKRVATPVVNKWYRLDLVGKQSYHKDHGEGYDGFKVGDSRGCGGLALWVDGKMVISDVYKEARVKWAGPDLAEFEALYEFPVVNGKKYFELRRYSLRMGERLTRITSRITNNPGRTGNALPGVAVVVGLFTQTSKPEYVFASDRSSMAVWETLDGAGLGTGVAFPKGAVLEMKAQPYAGEPKGFAHALAWLKTDAKGEVHYAAGYGWAKAGEITSLPEWRRYLETFAATMTKESSPARATAGQ